MCNEPLSAILAHTYNLLTSSEKLTSSNVILKKGMWILAIQSKGIYIVPDVIYLHQQKSELRNSKSGYDGRMAKSKTETGGIYALKGQLK